MGTLLSTYLLPKSDPNDDIPDDELGMTKREKEAVKQTMVVLKKDVKAAGIETFIRFFTAFPDYQKYFRAFANVPLSELKANKKLGAHATAVMYAFSSMVENLDDPENVRELIIKICEDHLPRGVSRPHFENLGNVLLAFLDDALGEVMTPTAKAGWVKLFNVVTSTADEVIEEKKRQKENC